MNLPNKLTVLRVIMVPFFVFFMLTGVGGAANKWIALIIFCVASLTDMLDGKIAAIVIFLGRAIVARSETLRKYAIPAPVISGLIFSIIVSCIKGAELISTSYTATMRTSISHQSKHIRTQSSLPRVRKHGKGMRYSLPPI